MSNRPLKSYDDFIFWNRANLQVLAIETMPTAEGGDYAKKLAQKHGCTVSYAIVQEYFVEPDKCPECGQILPESGPCWHNLFPEEEEPVRLTLAEMMEAEAEFRAKVETELYGRPISSCPAPRRGEL
jgi:hypothetical protein